LKHFIYITKSPNEDQDTILRSHPKEISSTKEAICNHKESLHVKENINSNSLKRVMIKGLCGVLEINHSFEISSSKKKN